MPRNVYSEINLHLTWHTKSSIAVLDPVLEDRVHRYIQHRILKTQGVRFHAIGGTETHVHLGVSVLPTLLISDWLGELKGASAYYANHRIANRRVLEWQAGYGVVSFGTRDLDWVVRYILNQKEHHAQGTVYERLERIQRESTGSP
jgi:REP element-mobilizing transposase RayT